MRMLIGYSPLPMQRKRMTDPGVGFLVVCAHVNLLTEPTFMRQEVGIKNLSVSFECGGLNVSIARSLFMFA